MDKLDYYVINNIISYLDYRSKTNFIQIDKYNYKNFKKIINYQIGLILKKKLKIFNFDKFTKIRLNYYKFFFLRKIASILLNIEDTKQIKTYNKFKSSKYLTNNLIHYKYLTIYNVKSILENYNFPITKKYKINQYIKKHFYNVYCMIDFL